MTLTSGTIQLMPCNFVAGSRQARAGLESEDQSISMFVGMEEVSVGV